MLIILTPSGLYTEWYIYINNFSNTLILSSYCCWCLTLNILICEHWIGICNMICMAHEVDFLNHGRSTFSVLWVGNKRGSKNSTLSPFIFCTGSKEFRLVCAKNSFVVFNFNLPYKAFDQLVHLCIQRHNKYILLNEFMISQPYICVDGILQELGIANYRGLGFSLWLFE